MQNSEGEPQKVSPPKISKDSRELLNERSAFFAFAFVLLLGLGLRLLFLAGTDFVIDSDEAIVGLMAKHINEGRPWPVFYYGQDYMGSLEAILTSASFKLLGMSSEALKLVPLLFSVLQVSFVYFLARYFLGRTASLIAALLCAVGPVTLILWSTKARGGFIEMMALGTLSLILSCELLNSKESNYSSMRLKSIGLGLVLGVGWWVNNQISFYMLPIGLIVGFHFFKTLSWRKAMALGLYCLAAFFVGGAPFWHFNIFGDPQWATFDVLFGGTEDVDFVSHLEGLFSDALPIIMGARRFWSDSDVFLGATAVFSLFYALGLLSLVRNAFLNKESRSSYILLLTFILSVMLIFCASRFGWLSKAPRYILPLYSVSFLVLAMGINSLLSARSPILRSSGFVSLLILLSAQLSPLVISPGITIGQPFVYRGDRVAKDHTELYNWLHQQGYRHIFTNYWIGYRVAFETKERITFSRFSEPLTLRIPEYEENEASYPHVYVLTPGQVEAVRERVKALGYDCRVTNVGGYVVVDKIQRRFPARESVVPLAAHMLEASSRQTWVSNAIDHDSATRWGSGEPQHPEMFFDINLDKPQLVSEIEIDFGRFVHDAPRHLVLYVKKTPQSDWEELLDLGDTTAMRGFAGSGDRIWDIGFKPTLITSLRLAQSGKHPVFDWSIAELRLYNPANNTKN